MDSFGPSATALPLRVRSRSGSCAPLWQSEKAMPLMRSVRGAPLPASVQTSKHRTSLVDRDAHSRDRFRSSPPLLLPPLLLTPSLLTPPPLR